VAGQRQRLPSQDPVPRAAQRRRLPGVERFEERVLLSDGPTVVDPNLAVRTVVTGLTTPFASAGILLQHQEVVVPRKRLLVGSSGR